MKTKSMLLIRDLLVTLFALTLSIISISMISKLNIDSSTEAFIPSQSEVVKINETIEKEFGSLDALVLTVRNENGSIINEKSLTLIETLTNKFEILDGVHSVLSITNLDHIDGDDFGMKVVPLFSGTTDNALNEMKKKLDSWEEIYENSLISENQKSDNG